MKNQKYEVVVFDVDGTLLDTSEGVLAAVSYAIKESSLPELSEEEMKTFIGPPIQDSLAKHYDLTPEQVQSIAEVFRDRYKGDDLLKAEPYEGIYQVFEELQAMGIRLAVATYKRQDYATRILEHFGFDKYTKILYGADNQNKLKKKDIIEKCMLDLGVHDYSKAVMIGDSDNDAIGAKGLGMDFIGVTYGFGFQNKDDVMEYQAVGCAEHPLDIVKILQGAGNEG